MLESRIPATCDICRQFWSYLQKNHVYFQTILSYDQKYLKKWNQAGILSPAFRGFCMPALYTVHPPVFKVNNYNYDHIVVIMIISYVITML